MNIAETESKTNWEKTNSCSLELQGFHPHLFSPRTDHRPKTAANHPRRDDGQRLWHTERMPRHWNQFISHQLLINNPSISSLRSSVSRVCSQCCWGVIYRRAHQSNIYYGGALGLETWSIVLPSGVQITAVKSGIVPILVQDVITQEHIDLALEAWGETRVNTDKEYGDHGNRENIEGALKNKYLTQRQYH